MCLYNQPPQTLLYGKTGIPCTNMKCSLRPKSVYLFNLVSKNHNALASSIYYFYPSVLPCIFLADFFFETHIVVEIFDSSDMACIDGKD